MKRSFLIFVILILSTNIFSQDWAPINTTEKFCFEKDIEGRISNVLWVDSTKSFSDYDVYYLNKMVYNEGSTAFLGIKQFLLDSIIVRENDAWEFCTKYPNGNYHFTLYPLADLNDSWDYSDGTNASITNKDTMSIFNEIDSIKTITIGNSVNIILSKNHGIIKWKNQYELIGIEGRELGITTIRFENMFSRISVGDIICRNTGHWEADDVLTGWESKYRYEVLNIEREPDQISIEVHSLSSTSYSYKLNFPEKSSLITTLIFHPNIFTDTYLNEAKFISSYEYPHPKPWIDGYMVFIESPHKWSGLTKTHNIYETLNYGPTSLYFDCNDTPNAICANPYQDEGVILERSQDFGFVEYENFGFEWGNWDKLVGVIDDGVTYGEIYPEDMFVGQNEMDKQSNLFIFPSPARDIIHVNSSFNGLIEWSIFDITGNILMHKQEIYNNDNLQISIKQIPNGVYFLQMQLGKETLRERFLKI